MLSVSEPNDGSDTCSLNCDFIKGMTGRDDITSRDMYQTNISYAPNFNVFLQCNDMPSIKKLDNGMTRRLRVINYPFQFVENPINEMDRKININLKDKLRSDNDLIDNFLLLLFEYAYNNINLKSIEQPIEVKDSINTYIEDNNPVKAFIDKYYTITKNKKDRILSSDFTKHINEKFDQKSEKLSGQKIKKDMIFNGFDIIIYEGLRYYYGLVLNKKQDDTDVFIENINPLDNI